MPSQTPRGLPYPLPTDPVSHGADDIRRLAEAVDPRLAEVPSAFRGQGLVTLPEGDGQMRIYTPSITYRFDLGPDNFAPDGYLALHFNRAGYYWVGMSAIVWNLSSHGGYAGCYLIENEATVQQQFGASAYILLDAGGNYSGFGGSGLYPAAAGAVLKPFASCTKAGAMCYFVVQCWRIPDSVIALLRGVVDVAGDPNVGEPVTDPIVVDPGEPGLLRSD